MSFGRLARQDLNRQLLRQRSPQSLAIALLDECPRHRPEGKILGLSVHCHVFQLPGHPVQHQLLSSLTIYRILRSEEHTSELQSLMRISYAVFCLKKKRHDKAKKHKTP